MITSPCSNMITSPLTFDSSRHLSQLYAGRGSAPSPEKAFSEEKKTVAMFRGKTFQKNVLKAFI